MADIEAGIRLTLDAGDATSKLGALFAALTELENTGTISADSLKQFEASAKAAAGGADALAHAAGGSKAELTGLGGALEAASRAAAGLGTSMELAGVESSGAAQKVRLMGEAVKELMAAAPELLILVAALEAVAKAAEFVKEGIGAAADMQSEMATMGAAVRAQGGDWDTAREGIEKFLESEALATGYTNGELASALNKIITAGHDVHDSMNIMAVATELARSKHIELGEATQLLISAEAGRAQGLVKLDGNLKDVVASHGKMSQVLSILHHDMEGAITDNNSLEMQQARLKVVIDQLGETLGSFFIPMLTNMAVTFIGAIKSAEDFGEAAGDTFKSIIDAANGARLAITAVAEALANPAQAAQDWQAAGTAFQQSGKDYHKGDDAAARWRNNGDAHARGQEAIDAAVAAAKKRGDGASQLDVDGTIGKEKSAGNQDATVSGTFYGAYKEQLDAVKAAQTALDAAILSSQTVLAQYKDNVANATSQMDQLKAKDVEAAHEQLVNEANLSRLTAAVAANHAANTSLTAQKAADVAALDKQAAAHDRLQAAMLAEGGGTADQKTKLQDLTDKYNDAKSKVDEDTKLIGENTENLKKNQAEQVATADKIRAQVAALNDVAVAWDTFGAKMNRDNQQHTDTEGMSHKDMAAYYNKQYHEDYANYRAALALKETATASYYEKLAEQDETQVRDQDRVMEDATTQYATWLTGAQKKYNEDLATWQMTNAQKVAYYRNAMAEIGIVTADNIQQREAMEQAYLNAEIAMIQDEKKARQEALKEETTYVDTFLTDLTDKTKGAGDAFKAIFADMEKAVIQSYSQMIVQSKLFQSVMGGAASGNSNSGIVGAIQSALGGGGNNAQSKATDEFKKSTDDFGKDVSTHHTDTGTNTTSTNNFQTSTNTYQSSTETYQGSTNTFQTSVQQFQEAVSRIGSGGGGDGGSSLGGLVPADGYVNGIPNFNGPDLDVPNAGPQTDAQGNLIPLGGPFDPNSLGANAPSVNIAAIGGSTTPVDMTNGLNVNLAAAGGSAIQSAGATMTSADIGGVLAGAASGASIAGMEGGNTTDGAIGGALGGGIGEALGGPLGQAVGSAIGGSIGGLFGPKYSATTNPDSDGNVDEYQQDLKNWQGTPGQAASQYDTGNGNLSESQQMEAWAAEQQNNLSNLTANQQALYNQIEGIDGGNNSADLTVTNLHQGMLTLANGQVISAAQMESLSENFAADSNYSASQQYIYQITRDAPNFNTALVSPWTAGTAGTSGTSGSGTVSTGQGGEPRAPLTVNMTINGFVGTSPQQTAQQLSTYIARILQTGYGNTIPV